LRGTAKKQHFNQISDAIVLVAGACGAGLGLIGFGWFGAVLGLGAGLAAGGIVQRPDERRR
jgi:membrane associated rhomboid family serine protease